MLDKEQQGPALTHVAYQERSGAGFEKDWREIDVKMPCDASGVHWVDLNGDGLDDFICIRAPVSSLFLNENLDRLLIALFSQDGAISASMNRGGNPPKFEVKQTSSHVFDVIITENHS